MRPLLLKTLPRIKRHALTHCAMAVLLCLSVGPEKARADDPWNYDYNHDAETYYSADGQGHPFSVEVKIGVLGSCRTTVQAEDNDPKTTVRLLGFLDYAPELMQLRFKSFRSEFSDLKDVTITATGSPWLAGSDKNAIRPETPAPDIINFNGYEGEKGDGNVYWAKGSILWFAGQGGMRYDLNTQENAWGNIDDTLHYIETHIDFMGGYTTPATGGGDNFILKSVPGEYHGMGEVRFRVSAIPGGCALGFYIRNSRFRDSDHFTFNGID
ncbi:hypothetical protein RJV04_005088 [Salmonella enterica]|nr:hypothetical protein [Salmonella enterica]